MFPGKPVTRIVDPRFDDRRRTVDDEQPISGGQQDGDGQDGGEGDDVSGKGRNHVHHAAGQRWFEIWR